MKRTTRNQFKKEFILNSIHKTGKLPSIPTLKQTLGRFDIILKDMISNNEISIVSESKYFKTNNEITGKSIEFKTKRVYKINNQYNPTVNNPYTEKLKNICLENRLKKSDKIVGMLLDNISSTLQNTKLGDKTISDEVKYKKGRFYTEVSNLPKEDRLKLKIDGEPIASIDIKASTIQLLLKSGVIKDNELLIEVQNPKFWDNLSAEFGVEKNRIKKRFISMVNGEHIDYYLYKRFKNFFSTIISIKSNYGYKTMSRLYNTIENQVMTTVYEKCVLNNIKFIPMHDEIIVKYNNLDTVKSYFDEMGILTTTETIADTTPKLTNTQPEVINVINELNNRKADRIIEKHNNNTKSFNRLEQLLKNAPKLTV
jgi:hypothetical protein